MAGIEKQKRKAAEECRKREEEAAERRKRFYNKAAPISMHIPKDSMYIDMKDEKYSDQDEVVY